MFIAGIVAVDKQKGIGYQNQLLFRSKEDLQLFQQKTMNQIVIMGRTTFDSLPKQPLRDRINMVLSRTKPTDTKGAMWFQSKEELMEYIHKTEDLQQKQIWVMGGSQIYALFQEDVQEWHVTEFDKIAEQKDAYFSIDLENHYVKDTQPLETVNAVVKVYKK